MSYASEQPPTLNGQTAATADSGAATPPQPARRGGAEADGAPMDGAPKRATPKGGAPRLNTNHLRAGLDCRPEVVAMRLELGSLPARMKRVEQDVYAFRRLLESSVIQAKDTINMIDAALIQTACRHERVSRLALAWLRKHEKGMTHGERLSYSKAIADSSAARDKALERLKLARCTADDWDDYYSGRTIPATPAADASNSVLRDCEATP